MGILLCIVVMAVSGTFLIRSLLSYRESQQKYDRLRQFTKVNTEEASHETTEEINLEGETAAEEKVKAPITVDFATLKSLNPDIVGWIYVEGLDISYPLVQAEDNDYYLHRNTDGSYNPSGSIFLEMLNKGDFTDPNTIIYGHNMKDKSMFGSLQEMLNKPEKRETPWFWILTPEGDYRYRVFSMQVTDPESDTYTIFNGRDKKFTDWCERMKDQSTEDMGDFSFTKEDDVVTLSTCANNNAKRTVLLGIRTNPTDTGAKA